MEWLRTRSLLRTTLLLLRYEKWFRDSVVASEGLKVEDLGASSDATSDDEVDSTDSGEEPVASDPVAPPLCAAPSESLPPPPLPPPDSCESAGENEAVAVVASDAPGSGISQGNLDALIELGDIYRASRPPAPVHRPMPPPKNVASTVESRLFHGKQFHEWKKGF